MGPASAGPAAFAPMPACLRAGPDARRGAGIRFDDERDARQTRRAGVTDGQRLDVEAAATHERRHASQDARLVGDEDYEGDRHKTLQL